MRPLLDTLAHGLLGDGAEDVLRARCRQFLVLFQHHRSEAEQILYAEIDRIVDVDARLRVHEFLPVGQVSANWTCHFLRPIAATR